MTLCLGLVGIPGALQTLLGPSRRLAHLAAGRELHLESSHKSPLCCSETSSSAPPVNEAFAVPLTAPSSQLLSAGWETHVHRDGRAKQRTTQRSEGRPWMDGAAHVSWSLVSDIITWPRSFGLDTET